MSQSDYIKYKKVSTVLSVDNRSTRNKLQPVLNSQEYSDYKEYVLENTILNSKTVYRRVVPSTLQVVLDMEKKKSVVQNMGTSLSNCPSFLLCKSTNLRKNRVPLLGSRFTPQPLNWQQTKNASWKKTGCNCILDSKYTDENICKCKSAV